MTRLSVFRKRNLYFVTLSILFIGLISVVPVSIKSFAQSNNSLNKPRASIVSPPASGNNNGKLAKTSPTRWITVDDDELWHIQKIF